MGIDWETLLDDADDLAEAWFDRAWDAPEPEKSQDRRETP